MPAVTYTPALRVMNADYAISGKTAPWSHLTPREGRFHPGSLKLGLVAGLSVSLEENFMFGKDTLVWTCFIA